MKKQIAVFASVCIVAIVSMSLISCTSDEDVISKANGNLEIKTIVDQTLIDDVNNQISEVFNTNTRVDEIITENQAKEILAPLVVQGKQIRNELMEYNEKGLLEMSTIEKNNLQNMNETDLAGLAYCQGMLEKGSSPEQYIPQLECTSQDVVDCLSIAVGFNAVSGLYGYISGTAQLMTAKTAIKIASSFIGRYLGWAGLAWAIYDFVDCLRSKQNVKKR